jgi:DNA-binding NarL/FixJ family response regulator
VTTVLVCDDEAVMREFLRDVLGDDPSISIVGEAADGDAVLRLAAAAQPDVVLLDLAMRGPPPRAVIAGLRHLAPAAAIVVLSGYGHAAFGLQAARQVTAHLPKTVGVDVLRRTVHEAAGRARRRPRAGMGRAG